ncbi:hypothetical protein [Paenibacillus segetis]|uniref:Polymer-forming cytoskeletal protein n=1 Tax=Paenibacillus segetis TaxID=1325360 RepID=A0ABQ1YNY4_9BACL|nr:hypothetical protein [Paenibacillus segetis]GGH33197.1 hypothetical protein GCM10008013_38140 [Paenibacillus segetis]
MDDHNQEMNRSNLKIVGDSGSNGGFFDKVSIVGDAEINGDVDCRTFKCTGTVKIDGSLKSDQLKATGDVTTSGSLQGGEMNLTGNLNISGSLTATKTRLNGDVHIGEGISGDEIGIFGSCTVKNGCQVEYFRLKGALQTEGMINAERVEMRLVGSSHAMEIVGGDIRVEPLPAWKWISMLKPWGTPDLKAELIEGDTVYLEHTVADVVRGGNVTIGPGCRIRRVEYRDHFRYDKQSEIAESQHIGENRN